MVCHGPDPPENHDDAAEELPRADLLMHGPPAHDSGDETSAYITFSRDEINEMMGYQPLPQARDYLPYHSDTDDDDDTEINEVTAPHQSFDAPTTTIDPIEPMESVLTREVWNEPRTNDPIEMDSARAQEVMSAMANFRLPATAIPEWARTMSEEQLQRTLVDTVHRMKGNT